MASQVLNGRHSPPSGVYHSKKDYTGVKSFLSNMVPPPTLPVNNTNYIKKNIEMVNEISRMRSLEKVTNVHKRDGSSCIREESEKRGKINILGTSKKTKHVEVLNGSSRAVKMAPTFQPVMSEKTFDVGQSHRSYNNDYHSSRGCL